KDASAPGASSGTRAPATHDEFARSRDEIVKKNSGIVEKAAMAQLSELEKKIDEIKKLQLQSAGSTELHPSIRRIQDLLSQNEFTFNYIQEMTDKMKRTFPLERLEDFEAVQRTVVDWIGETISIAPQKAARKPHVFILVGPTGVGKTTTLVKLAAQYVKNAQNSGSRAELCFITTDTMRVGALEQLSRFGEIFGKNVQKAESAADVRKIYEDCKERVDAVFIDTSGYSPNDASHIGTMKMTLDVPGMNPAVFLTVTASTKARDLDNIMKNYEPFGYQSVIVTKCDESEQYGNVISVLHERHKSVSYITSGQNITNSRNGADGRIASNAIERTTPVTFLIRLEGFSIDRTHIEDRFGE
ncbi:MAG: hypothetical protein K2H09_06830, partial [Treponemataceae bacterium]|nr:hypothetical protein [Treponemataceae bacterium]